MDMKLGVMTNCFIKDTWDVAVKKAPISPWAGRIPTREKGIAAMMTSGVVRD